MEELKLIVMVIVTLELMIGCGVALKLLNLVKRKYISATDALIYASFLCCIPTITIALYHAVTLLMEVFT